MRRKSMKLRSNFAPQGEKKTRSRRAIWALAMGLFIVVVALFVVLPIVKSKKPKASYGLVAVGVTNTDYVWFRLDKKKKVKAYGADGMALSLNGKDVEAAASAVVAAYHAAGKLDGATVTVFAVTGKAETESELRESALVGAENAILQSGANATAQKYTDGNAAEEAKRLKITLGKYVIITEILQFDASKSVRTLATKGMDALIDDLQDLYEEN